MGTIEDVAVFVGICSSSAIVLLLTVLLPYSVLVPLIVIPALALKVSEW